ncbi:MAG: AtpZ/AtpI family protein [bacterium]
MKQRVPGRPTVWKRLPQDPGASGGYDLAACVLVGWGLGWASQRFLGVPAPWGLLAGILLGSASGFYQLFKVQVLSPRGKEGRKRDGDGHV